MQQVIPAQLVCRGFTFIFKNLSGYTKKQNCSQCWCNLHFKNYANTTWISEDILKCKWSRRCFVLTHRCRVRSSPRDVVRSDLLLCPHRRHALLLFLVLPNDFALDDLWHELACSRQLLQQQCRHQLDYLQHFRTEIFVRYFLQVCIRILNNIAS